MSDRDSALAECVFCSRRDQPAVLLETASLYVMPDKFSMRRGHLLIVSRVHRPCFGAAPIGALDELDRTAEHLRRFLKETYGGSVFTFENGVSGQSVFHAHLHLLPCEATTIPPAIVEDGGLATVDGWSAVRAHFARHGHYRYAALEGKRFLHPGAGPSLEHIRAWLAGAAGVDRDERGWIKRTTADDARAIERLWAEFGARRGGPSAAGRDSS